MALRFRAVRSFVTAWALAAFLLLSTVATAFAEDGKLPFPK